MANINPEFLPILLGERLKLTIIMKFLSKIRDLLKYQ